MIEVDLDPADRAVHKLWRDVGELVGLLPSGWPCALLLQEMLVRVPSKPGERRI